MTTNTEFIRRLSFQNEYLGLAQSQTPTLIGNMLCVVFLYTLKPMVPNIEFIRSRVSKILKGDIHWFSEQMFWCLFVAPADND